MTFHLGETTTPLQATTAVEVGVLLHSNWCFSRRGLPRGGDDCDNTSRGRILHGPVSLRLDSLPQPGDAFVTHPLRTFVGCAALAVGMWAITSPATADTPALPANSYKKAAEADLKFLQTRLADLAKKKAAGEKLLQGQIKPALGVSLLLTAYGEALGDATLKADSLKIAEAIEKGDFKTADELAKKLTVKPGTPGKLGPLPKPFKTELMLESVMSPFRGSSVGGMNIERDIRDMSKAKGAKIDPAEVEILAVRSSVINAYAAHAPNDKASVNAANKKLWEKWAMEATDTSNQLAAEAAKGAKADEKKLKTLLSNLNARCSDCHEKFRDE